jgi:hypothetical protein
VPRKKQREAFLIQRTQKFKDIRNVQAIILIHQPSGIPIYSHSFTDVLKGKNTLFSGFIQAISIIGQEITRDEPANIKGKRLESDIDYHKVVELDLKQFHCLILDLEELRTVIILKSKSSKRLKDIMLHFSFAFYLKMTDRIKNFDGDLSYFAEETPQLIKEYFEIFYKEPFKISITESDLNRYKKKYSLSKKECNIIEDIFAILEENSCFKLMDLVEREDIKDEDRIIHALESLIELKLICPIK